MTIETRSQMIWMKSLSHINDLKIGPTSDPKFYAGWDRFEKRLGLIDSETIANLLFPRKRTEKK